MSERPASPIDNQTGRPPLARDGQQWILDYLIQETGKAYHFQGDKRGDLPKSVRSHAMISKHVAKKAIRLEQLARSEEQAGHPETALHFFYQAAVAYADAQHPIMALNDEKAYLYAGVRRCYDHVCALAPYRLEHLEIPWGDTLVSGNLHLNPASTGPAPLLFQISGCDTFKEVYPHPHYNFVHQRGMHVFAFDGPGQAESVNRGIPLTPDNYEQAASAALDHLVELPEIDEHQVVVHANSFGAFWGLRFAAHDDRVRAVAATCASICEKYIQTDLESPRWKQLLAFLTGARDEHELDVLLRAMTMDGYMDKIACPVVMTVGEYDPRAPLPEMYRLFDQMKAPAELWVMVDQHHRLSIGDSGGPNWARAGDTVAVDWLRDRLAGEPMEHPGQVLRVQGEDGRYSPSTQLRRHWFDGAT